MSDEARIHPEGRQDALKPSEFLLHFSDRLRGLADPVEVALCAAEMLGRHLRVPRAGYGEIDEAEEVVRVRRDWTDGTVASLAGEARILNAFGPAVIAELRAGHTLVVEDFLADRRAGQDYAETWASIETRALIVVPLVKGGRLRAILYLHEPQARSWTDDEARLAREVAERTWDALERARAEAALRESEARLRLFSEASRDGVMVHDGRIVLDCNDVFASMYGYAGPADLIGRDAYVTLAPESLQAIVRKIEARVEALSEVIARRKDGSTFPAEVWAREAEWQGRRVRIVLARDLTEQRRADARLLETQRRLNAVLNNASVSIFLMDERQHCIYMNAAAEKLTGFTLDEVQGRPLHDVIHHTRPDGRHFPLEECAIDRAFPENNQTQGEEVFVRRDGSFYPIAFTASPIRDEDAKTVGTIIEVRDISSEKKAQEHQQLLINELNHRVKNTLTTVQSIAAQTLRNATTMGAAKDALESRLLALSRAHDVLTRESWEGANLHDIVAQAVAPYSSLGEDRLHLSGPMVWLPPRMALAVAMALQELATNAVKYGALSNVTGEIRIAWGLEQPAGELRLRLVWTESGGPPVREPDRRGFGTRLIERSLGQDLGGDVEISFFPQGLVCSVSAPLLAS
jgi:PAS domain S-box-containing protein